MGTITDPNASEYGTIIHLLLDSKIDINAISTRDFAEKRKEITVMECV